MLNNLPTIQFAQKDTAVIEAEIIKRFESAWLEATGDSLTLYPGDPRRLLLLTVAEELVLQRYNIDFAAKQNLLAYAQGWYLDHLAVHVGVERLPAQPAKSTFEFTLSIAHAGVQIIPQGTRITPDGVLYFMTTEPGLVPIGEKKIQVPGECMVAGTQGNNYQPGQIKTLVDPLPWIQSVENITVSAGGADVEDDENLRERTQLAPESFSVAGPTGAYQFYAKGAHQGIVDVAVIGPPETEPGNVEIYPLMIGGEIPSQEILDAVLSICDAEDTRPDTDHVFVLPPEQIAYELNVTYWIDRARATQATSLQASIEKSIQLWVDWQRGALGRDINPSELNHRMVAAGAKRTEISSPSFTVLSAAQVGIPENITISFGGLEDG